MSGKSWFYLEFKTEISNGLPPIHFFLDIDNDIIFNNIINNNKISIIPFQLKFSYENIVKLFLNTNNNIQFSLNFINSEKEISIIPLKLKTQYKIKENLPIIETINLNSKN